MTDTVSKLLRHRARRILAACRLLAAEIRLQLAADELSQTCSRPMRHEKRRELLAKRLRAEFRLDLCRAAYRRATEVARGHA